MKLILSLLVAICLLSTSNAQTAATIKTGMKAPEINLPALGDTTLSLSSLKGNVVLVDFWASWCMPCRKSNPELVKIYNRFKDKGFQIYGVSIDLKKDDWLKAIQKDKLTWLQVIDQKGWYAQSTYDYGLEGLPASFLLDQEGFIRGINLSGKKLNQEIEKLLAQ